MKIKLGSGIVTLVATFALALACLAFTACGETEKGTYTTVIASHDYYAVQSVKDYMTNNPGKYVKTEQLFQMLNSDIATEGEFKTSGGVADYYTVKLELKEGNKYTLTKQFKMGENAGAMTQMPEDKKPEIRLEFHGDYTVDGDKVTLKAPESLTGNFVAAGEGIVYTHFAKNCENINLKKADMDDIEYPGKFFYYFNTQYFVISETVTDMTVTLDKSNKDALTLKF